MRTPLIALLPGLLIPPLPLAGQCFYEAIVIQAPPCSFVGSPPTLVGGINDAGEVVGTFSMCGPPYYDESFIWSEAEGMHLLERPPGVQSIFAQGINSHGVVAGTAYINNDTDLRAFAYTDHVMTVFEPDGYFGYSSGAAVNDAGIVVGTRDVGPFNTGFAWSRSGGFTDLAPVTGANAINGAGVIVGVLGGFPAGEGFLYDESGLHALGVPFGAIGSGLNAINASQTAVGYVTWEGGDLGVYLRAAIWSNGAWLLLRLPAEPTTCQSTVAHDINNVGQVVGHCALSAGGDRGLLWIDGEVVDLTSALVSTELFYVAGGTGINAAGEIAAVGIDTNSDVVGLVLRPLDRPAADITGDCRVGISDLQYVISNWGHPDSAADVNNDGSVGFADLVRVLIDWNVTHPG